jgi:hypothetical protein
MEFWVKGFGGLKVWIEDFLEFLGFSGGGLGGFFSFWFGRDD